MNMSDPSAWSPEYREHYEGKFVGVTGMPADFALPRVTDPELIARTNREAGIVAPAKEEWEWVKSEAARRDAAEEWPYTTMDLQAEYKRRKTAGEL